MGGQDRKHHTQLPAAYPCHTFMEDYSHVSTSSNMRDDTTDETPANLLSLLKCSIPGHGGRLWGVWLEGLRSDEQSRLLAQQPSHPASQAIPLQAHFPDTIDRTTPKFWVTCMYSLALPYRNVFAGWSHCQLPLEMVASPLQIPVTSTTSLFSFKFAWCAWGGILCCEKQFWLWRKVDSSAKQCIAGILESVCLLSQMPCRLVTLSRTLFEKRGKAMTSVYWLGSAGGRLCIECW